MIYYTRYVKKYVCFWKNRHVTAITSIYVTAAVCQTEAANLWHCSFRSRLWLGELGVQRLTDRMNFPCSYAGCMQLVMEYLPYTFRSHRKLHRNVGFKYSLRPMDPSWETALHSTPPLFTCILYFTFCLTASLQRKFHGVKTFPPPPVHLLQSTSKALDVFCIIAPTTNQLATKCPNERATDESKMLYGTGIFTQPFHFA